MKILQKQSEMQGRASLVRNFKCVLFLFFFCHYPHRIYFNLKFAQNALNLFSSKF